MVEELKKYLGRILRKEWQLACVDSQLVVGNTNGSSLCENLDVSQIHLVDLDEESIELSKIFHKHYAQDKFVNIRHWNLDIPFEFENLNKIEVDVVICIHTEQMYPLQELNGKNASSLRSAELKRGRGNVWYQLRGIS